MARSDIERSAIRKLLDNHPDNWRAIYRAILTELKNGATWDELYNQLLDIWSISEDMISAWIWIPDDWKQGKAHYTYPGGWY